MKLVIKSDQAFVFRLIISDPTQFEYDLESQISSSPAMFLYAPVILEIDQASDIPVLVSIARKHLLNPVAIRSAIPENKSAADLLRLPCWPTLKSADNKKPNHGSNKPMEYKVHTKTVRSGQQIYAKDAHLIISQSVGAGAEVLADGDIHIYGELRGRAMAGVSGRKESQIFCSGMKAELVAIAGDYIVSDDMPEIKGAAQIRLDQDSIQFHNI